MFSEEELNNLEELLIYLEDADRGFSIVEVNQYEKQTEILKKIELEVPESKKIIIDFKKEHLNENSTHINFIKKISKENPNIDIIIILNLPFLGESDTEIEEQLVRDLNFSRDIYANLNKLLVFFLPSYFVDLLIKRAVDFWNFVSVKFDFISTAFMGRKVQIDEPIIIDKNFLDNRKTFLENLLKNDKISDAERLDALTKLAKTLQDLYKFDKAENYYFQSLRLSKSLNDKETEASILSNLGLIYKLKGEYKRSLKYSSKSLFISKNQGNIQAVTSALNNMGRLYDTIGDYENALKYLNESLDTLNQYDNTELKSSILNNIGLIYMHIEELDMALKCFNESLTISSTNNYKRAESSALHNLATYNEKILNYKEALRYYQDAYNVETEIYDMEGQAATLNNMAMIYMQLGNLSKSLKYLNDSLNIRTEIDDKNGIEVTLNNLGQLYNNMGEFNTALDFTLRSLELQEKLGYLVGKDITLKNLSLIYSRLGNYEKAEEYLRKSQLIAKKLSKTEPSSIKEHTLYITEDSINETSSKPKKELGRNDLCPCGSGKKYKKCCGK